jgi:hypothetical protein
MTHSIASFPGYALPTPHTVSGYSRLSKKDNVPLYAKKADTHENNRRLFSHNEK